PQTISDLWLGDVGIRVTDLERSMDFYTKVFDLEEIDRGGDEHSTFVLLRDRRSRQRLELNWYAEDNPFWAPYVPGEALDSLRGSGQECARDARATEGARHPAGHEKTVG